MHGKAAVECETCARERAAEMAQKRADWLAAGLCGKCGAARDGLAQLCKRHRKAANRRQQAYRAKQKDNARHFSLASKTPAGLLVDQPGRVFTPAEQ